MPTDRKLIMTKGGNERILSGCGAPEFPFTEKYETLEEEGIGEGQRDIMNFFAANEGVMSQGR